MTDDSEKQWRLECVRLAIDVRRGPYPIGNISIGNISIAALASEFYQFVRDGTLPPVPERNEPDWTRDKTEPPITAAQLIKAMGQ